MFRKQYNTKEIEYYYWLKMNISEFRLILLDHITNVDKSVFIALVFVRNQT